MAAIVQWVTPEDASGLGIVNMPGGLLVSAQPPDNVVLFVPMPGGGYAKAVVDAHQLDTMLAEAHEKLIEAAADQAEAEETAPAAGDAPTADAPPPPPPPEEPADDHPPAAPAVPGPTPAAELSDE